jgi:UDP-glucose 4-epimerase
MSPYAVQKLAGEGYLRAFSECFDMETVALRYFNVFGPRQDPNSPYSAAVPLFASAVLEGHSPTVYGDGLQTRDFTYVENVVRANILAATGDYQAQGQVYNIACGGSHSVLDLLAGINAALGTDVAPNFEPHRVGDVRNSMADISRAQADLGYQVAVSFEEGLRRTVAWYREHVAR